MKTICFWYGLVIVLSFLLIAFIIIISVIMECWTIRGRKYMEKVSDNVKLWFAIQSEILQWLGISMIALASAWDFMMSGGRGFLDYDIDYKGVIIIWIGVLLIVLSKKALYEIEKQ